MNHYRLCIVLFWLCCFSATSFAQLDPTEKELTQYIDAHNDEAISLLKEVTATGDIRCISPEQLAKTQAKMKAIVAEHLPQTEAAIIFDEGYPPFAPTARNNALLGEFSKVSQDLGFGPVKPVNPRNAGAADISFTSGLVAMGIDGMGMGGADDHTINEAGDLRTLPMQSKRAAALLYRLLKSPAPAIDQ